MKQVVFSLLLYLGVVGVAWGLAKDKSWAFYGGSFCLGIFGSEAI